MEKNTTKKPLSAKSSAQTGSVAANSPGIWCGRRPDDPRPIVYQGCHTSDAKILIRAGLRSFCVTYYDSWKNGPEHLLKHIGYTDKSCRLFLDSGAFSFLTLGYQRGVSRKEIEAQVDKYVESYSEWVTKHGRRFDFYVTFDYLVEAPIVYQMTKKLQKMGIFPVPVYHGDSSIDWLRRYIDEGHKLIGISKRFFLNDLGGLSKFYDQVFTLTEKAGVSCHGFACTGKEAWTYPFWSIDSTTLVRMAGNGTLWFISERGGLRIVPISRASRSTPSKELMNIIEARGLTLKGLRDERSLRVLFNGITVKEFTENRKAIAWKKPTLF